MKNIKIEDSFRKVIPTVRLGVMQGKVIFEKKNEDLWLEINNYTNSLFLEMTKEEIKLIPRISDSRLAYKKLGKKSSDGYDISSEALLKRVFSGKNLFNINNIVDTSQLLSIMSRLSIGIYDLDKIEGDITFKIGSNEDTYKSLGKGMLKSEKLPILVDQTGGFGSPTSDSVRTCISENTKRVIMIMMVFSVINLDNILTISKNYYKRYANLLEGQIDIIQ